MSAHPQANLCERIAWSYFEKVPGLLWQKTRGLWGNSFISSGDEKILEAPTPNTPAKLHIFLHELFHWYYKDPEDADEQAWKECRVKHSDFFQESRVDKDAYDVMKHHGVEWTRPMWKHAVLNIQHAKRRHRKCAHVDSEAEHRQAEDWLEFCKAHAGKVTGRAFETR